LHTAQNTAFVPPSPRFSDGRKLNGAQKAMIFAICQEQPDVTTSQLLTLLHSQQQPLHVTQRHVNRLRRRWKVSRSRGRPQNTDTAAPSDVSNQQLIALRPQVAFLGLHLFDSWLHKRGVFVRVIEELQLAIADHLVEHPEDDFALLSHKAETLLRRFQALYYAPLFGIGKLTQYDLKPHALPTLVGRSYQSSTLNQFLGQLERISAGDYLMETLLPEQVGEYAYIDGHMLAFWSSRKLHKGLITMLNRVMAGSQAVIAHNQHGMALFFEYYPPDTHLNTVILSYCEKLHAATGLQLFIIDREVNCASLAKQFESRGWGLLSMLNRNQYKGLECFQTTTLEYDIETKTTIYRGQWADEKKRDNDPRHFVIEVCDQRISVFWGTSRVVTQIQESRWPEVYRKRAEINENSFKRMNAHGALKVNFGTKLLMGPDRHQQRAKEKLEEAERKAVKKRAKKEEELKAQAEKVAESEQKGHGKRLEQRKARQEKLEEELEAARDKEERCLEQLEQMASPQERGDRDLRKQKIMTFRTLLLENWLLLFLQQVVGMAQVEVGIETFLDLLIRRPGALAELNSHWLFWLDSEGLSKSHRATLEKLALALTQMQLLYLGKSIEVRIRDGTY